MKIYTKTGDKGETSLFGGKRISKADLRIESYGTVDELNSFVGLLRDSIDNEHYRAVLKHTQVTLFDLGATLARDPDNDKLVTPSVDSDDIQQLEKEMDEMDQSLEPLKNFILPGGHPVVSYAHLARCVCRRAERQVVQLAHEAEIDELIIRYLNRLSDYLFVLSRKLASDLNVGEVYWIARK